MLVEENFSVKTFEPVSLPLGCPLKKADNLEIKKTPGLRNRTYHFESLRRPRFLFLFLHANLPSKMVVVKAG